MIERRAKRVSMEMERVQERDKLWHIFSINFNTFSNNVVIFYDEYLHLDGLRHTKKIDISRYRIFIEFSVTYECHLAWIQNTLKCMVLVFEFQFQLSLWNNSHYYHSQIPRENKREKQTSTSYCCRKNGSKFKMG